MGLHLKETAGEVHEEKKSETDRKGERKRFEKLSQVRWAEGHPVCLVALVEEEGHVYADGVSLT